MDLAHICKSADLNMQIYRMEYANLQDWICTFTQSNMTFYRVAYVWHIPLCRMSYVIHIPSCRYKYVIDICPNVSEEMDLKHTCKSTEWNMQIYRMEYTNLQNWICKYSQSNYSNMTFYRVAYVCYIPLCRMSYVIHIPSCRYKYGLYWE